MKFHSSKKENLIITACDAKYGDFLIQDWLKSLQDNVKLEQVDIVVLDYGLTELQRKELLKKKVGLIPCKKDGNIVNIRFRDTASFLEKTNYIQVLMCDSGDIIFQTDINKIFNQNKEHFKAVCEELMPPMLEYTLSKNIFSKTIKLDIIKTLAGKRMINAGFLLGPPDLFKDVYLKFKKFTKNNQHFGTDQIIINYIFYKLGFEELDNTYNFIPVTAKDSILIKNGVFYDKKKHKKIKVLHNAGNTKYFRVIRNFGYKKHHNVLNKITYRGIRIFYKTAKIFRPIILSVIKKLNR